MVLALAYTLFALLVHLGLPHLAEAFESLGLVITTPLRRLIEVGELAPYWWPIGPILLVVLGIVWYRSGRAAQFQKGAWSGLRMIPWMRSTLADYETSNFAGLLGLLLEHEVAYPAALVLAADATGDANLARGATQMAAAIERGDPATRASRGRPENVSAHASLDARHWRGSGLARRLASQSRRDVQERRAVIARKKCMCSCHSY